METIEIPVPNTTLVILATAVADLRVPEAVNPHATHVVAICADIGGGRRVVVGRGNWDGFRVLDCPADLGEEVWDAVESALTLRLGSVS